MQDETDVRSIYIACDPYGETLKDAMLKHMREHPAVTVVDLGTDKYFDAAAKVSKSLTAKNPPPATPSTPSTNAHELGIVICGTGTGVAMAANKFTGVRAATCDSMLAARCARAINNANVLCLGGLFTSPALAASIVDAFILQGFVSRPSGDDGTPIEWWNDDVEKFLRTSMEGFSRVEREAIDVRRE